jgi:serine/threonine protein kinase
MEFSGLQNTLWHSGIPTILYEYGEHGSMTTFLERTSGIGEGVGSEMKRQLALDVGHGILALHSLGVVHGDLKYI